MLELYGLRINSVREPVALPVSGLRAGWKLRSDKNCILQTSYRMLIKKGAEIAFDSGVVDSDESSQVPLEVTLESRSDYILTVVVTDNYGETAETSLCFSTEIRPCEWLGKWIKPAVNIEGWAPYVRTKFSLNGKEVKKAVLYVSGLGCGEYYLNGKKVSQDLIDPPFTNYEIEVLYRVYNVTDFISEDNAFVAFLGEGWYSQSLVWDYGGFKFGDVCLIAQLELTFKNGEKKIIATTDDGSWKYKYSPIVLNNLYAGEVYDARLETSDFADYIGSEEGWGDVVADPIPKGELKPCLMPAVREVRRLKAKSVRQLNGKDGGAWIFDMGENIAGFAEFYLPYTAKGQRLTFRFAETVTEDGYLDFRSSGAFATQCIQQDEYIAKGDPNGEIYKPRFTYHGFRYIEITGFYQPHHYGLDPTTDFAVAIVTSTDLEKVGEFTSSNEDMNHLHTIMMSTFRSNYHGFPEDCPAREKCGWLGDAQVVCNTGIMNYDMEAAYEKYMSDIRTTPDVYGTWNMISPGKRGCGEATPLWGCAQIIIPYYMFIYYGNRQVVKDNWERMEQWVQHELEDSLKGEDDYIITRGIGDWCPPIGNEGERRIPVAHSSTFMFYEVCLRMSELSREFGYAREDYYDDLAAKIKTAVIKKFWDDKKSSYGFWGSDGVALEIGLYPDGAHDRLLCALVDMIKKDDYAMSTGIYANKYLIPALCRRGYGDIALKFMFNRDHVSFGTMMDDGATSLWECLEMKNTTMPREVPVSSYNHPMHSGFAYFYYSEVGGIKPILPGFKEFEISPAYFDGISSATVSHITPYGEIKVSFKRDGKTTDYSFNVPENTFCTFKVGKVSERFGSGSYSVSVQNES